MFHVECMRSSNKGAGVRLSLDKNGVFFSFFFFDNFVKEKREREIEKERSVLFLGTSSISRLRKVMPVFTVSFPSKQLMRLIEQMTSTSEHQE
jgi:hypothetical protein